MTTRQYLDSRLALMGLDIPEEQREKMVVVAERAANAMADSPSWMVDTMLRIIEHARQPTFEPDRDDFGGRDE